MGLDVTTLTSALEGIFSAAAVKGSSVTSSTVASQMANAFEAFVKSGAVTVASGIPVSTTGTAAAQTGSTTADGSGTIS